MKGMEKMERKTERREKNEGICSKNRKKFERKIRKRKVQKKQKEYKRIFERKRGCNLKTEGKNEE